MKSNIFTFEKEKYITSTQNAKHLYLKMVQKYLRNMSTSFYYSKLDQQCH